MTYLIPSLPVEGWSSEMRRDSFFITQLVYGFVETWIFSRVFQCASLPWFSGNMTGAPDFANSIGRCCHITLGKGCTVCVLTVYKSVFPQTPTTTEFYSSFLFISNIFFIASSAFLTLLSLLSRHWRQELMIYSFLELLLYTSPRVGVEENGSTSQYLPWWSPSCIKRICSMVIL